MQSKNKITKTATWSELTTSMNTADLWPRQLINQHRQLINQHNYHVMTHSRTCDIDEPDPYTDSYITRQKQIRLDAVLSWQIQAEEKSLAEHIRQIENKRSIEYQQTTPDPPLLNRHTDEQRPEKLTNEERFENPNQNLQDSFRDKHIYTLTEYRILL